MKKIEIIWREILYQALERGNREFVQKSLAEKCVFSTSTVFAALKVPRRLGAVKVSGRNFILLEPKKLLYHWASVRNLPKDTIYQTRVDLPLLELEKSLPPGVVFAAYSAFVRRFHEAPADYDRVYAYADGKTLENIKNRFPPKRGYPNLIVLKADPFLSSYGPLTVLAQTFVDLWNLPEWYARNYYLVLEEKIDAILA